ncbi:MAG: hypothetical protein NZ957_01090 [Thaumarchaeota archaeon]|nr:hypothetical protein [Candidatus Calditenuaceae archaeon]MDW8041185.1 hypothetical protein [Nitrososphaerota archaeon]
MSHVERFSRIARRVLEHDVDDEELEKLAKELVELKRKIRAEHGLEEGSGSTDEVRRQFERFKALRAHLGLERGSSGSR